MRSSMKKQETLVICKLDPIIEKLISVIIVVQSSDVPDNEQKSFISLIADPLFKSN